MFKTFPNFVLICFIFALLKGYDKVITVFEMLIMHLPFSSLLYVFALLNLEKGCLYFSKFCSYLLCLWDMLGCLVYGMSIMLSDFPPFLHVIAYAESRKRLFVFS